MKRSISFIAIFALLCTVLCFFPAFSLAETVTGDADGDGKITFEDYILIRLASNGYASLEDISLSSADTDGNGSVDSKDAGYLKSFVCGSTLCLPKDCGHSEGIRSRNADGEVELNCSDCGISSVMNVPENVKVAYIPIDDRPVNVERVKYLARSVGIKLLMPDTDLFRTCLDNMTKNKNGTTYGDRAKLLEWLKKADEECDYFVISLDQMLSGGLVSSRWLDNTDLTFEYEIADAIIRLCENNTVVLFDTVMRLASTNNYMGYQMDEYDKLRAYGKAERKILTGDKLTVENIIATYRYDKNGKPVTTDLPEKAITKYHASRRRKLVLADYILRNVGDTADFIYYGVDDSTPQNTIQTNEINYIRNLIGDHGVISAACDELGMCCLTRIACKLYGNVNVNVEYFGPGKDKPADQWDIGTLASNVETHLVCFDTETEPVGKGKLDILVLTQNNTSDDINKLIDRINENIKNGVPTAVIDANNDPRPLGKKLVENCVDLCQLLGYSSWNTAGNALGIAMSLGISRYSYLSAVGKSTSAANEGFLKSMTFAYAKDISYKGYKNTVNGWLDGDYECSVKKILSLLNAGKIVTSVTPYTAENHGKITVSGARYPWNRTFEATFTILIYG